MVGHNFTCLVICNAASIRLARKILEAFFISLFKPFLNDQIDSDILNLFKNGVTCFQNCIDSL